MVFHRYKWVPIALGVALSFGISPGTAKGDCDLTEEDCGQVVSGTATQVGNRDYRAQINMCGTIPRRDDLDPHHWKSIVNGSECTFTLIHMLYDLSYDNGSHPQELVCATFDDLGNCLDSDPKTDTLPDRISTIPLIQDPKKQSCKGDDNDVTCKDDRRPSFSIKVNQRDDKTDLTFCLKVDRAVIPHNNKDDIHFPVSLETAFQLKCPGGTFDFDDNASWRVTSKPDADYTNVRTP
jgi:hypothetical protein